MNDFLLMSIKTKYADMIFNGTKVYEFRRKSIGEKNLNKKIYIYSSEEKREIVGYIIIDKILEGSVKYLLSETLYEDKKSIKEYFKDVKVGFAFHIKEVYKFLKPIKLDEVKFVVPQFYRYISLDEELYKAISIRKVTHNMNLQLEFFNYIKNGTKRIELRLFDEKRKLVNIHDRIIFSNNKNGEKLVTLVTGIHKASTFEKLIQYKTNEILADKDISKEIILKKLNKFYSMEEQLKCGVIGIEVNPMYTINTSLNKNIINEIYELTHDMEKFYGDYKTWLYKKQCIKSEDRISIYIKENNKIIGVCNLKLSENKICTIYVDKYHRNLGISSILLDEAFKYLKNVKPYVTCHKDNMKYFDKLVSKYNWKHTDTVGEELIFNGGAKCQ